MEKKESILLKDAGIGYNGAVGKLQLMSNIHLAFYPNDFVGIVGLNGVGKSTFLKSICGLLPLLNGELFLNGKQITQLTLPEIAKKIAVVLTEKIGGFNLTVFDAVASGQIPYTNSFHHLKEEHIAIIASAIERSGLKKYQSKLLHELSDGLFQKTMIAKALAQQTPALLLDEPTAFLDYGSKHELFLFLKKLSEEENKCVLVSSHDLDLVLKYCTKLLVISENKLELIPASEANKNTSFVTIGKGFI